MMMNDMPKAGNKLPESWNRSVEFRTRRTRMNDFRKRQTPGSGGVRDSGIQRPGKS